MNTQTITRPPTQRQMDVLRVASEFTAAHGYPPTTREIGDALGITTAPVWAHLKELERKGYVQREHSGVARSLRITEEGAEVMREQNGRTYYVAMTDDTEVVCRTLGGGTDAFVKLALKGSASLARFRLRLRDMDALITDHTAAFRKMTPDKVLRLAGCEYHGGV